MLEEKGWILHLAPGLLIVDEDSRLSKDSAGTTTELVRRKIYEKSKINIITKHISSQTRDNGGQNVRNSRLYWRQISRKIFD